MRLGVRAKNASVSGFPRRASIALLYTDSLWLENCMISQSFEPPRGRVAKVLVQKLLRAVEAEKQGLAPLGKPRVLCE